MAKGQKLKAYTFQLVNSSGQSVYTQKLESLTDFNHLTLDPRWLPGLYFLQLYENGQLLASGKVVIQ
jgi:hypothetical protein